MKNVTNSFKENIRTYGRQFDFRIKLNDILSDEDNFNYIKPTFNGNLFGTIMHQLKIDTKLLIQKGTKINVQAGVKLNNTPYEYINYNTYYTGEPERKEDTISYEIIANDKMKESMIDYDLDISEKITLRNYLIRIFNRLSWNVKNIPTSFINSNKLIDPVLHKNIGFTFRDVLDEIAILSCSVILFKGDNPYLIYPNETNINIDESYLNEDNITIGEKYYINSLVFSRAEESDNIYRKDDTSISINGLHEFKISDCQLLSTNDRDQYIDAMFNYLKNLNFYVFDVTSKGILFLEAYDKFNFILDGKTYPTLLLNNETIFDDGLVEGLYTDRPEESETEYKYADETDKRINQAYIIVDKQNKEITARVEDVEKTVNKNVATVQVEYYLSSSKTELKDGKWETVAPEWEEGKYMWSRTTTILADGTVKTSDPTCIAGATGQSGQQGPQGVQGPKGEDGKTYYTWIKYADTPTSGISDSPTNKKYIGIASNKSTATESTNYSDYSWSLIKGDKGDTGSTGATGATGNGISSIEYYYAKTSTQTPPSASSITSTTMPTLDKTNKYLWQKEVITFTTTTEKQITVLLLAVYGDTGEKGDTGKGVKKIVPQYYKSTSKTKVEGGSWQETEPEWEQGKYIWTRSHITWTDNTTSDTDPVLATGLNEALGNSAEAKKVSNQVSELIISKGGILERVKKTEDNLVDVQGQTNLNTDEIARAGQSATVEGYPIEVNASNNSAELLVYGNTVQDGEPSPDYPSRIRNVGDNINIFDGLFELGIYNGNTGKKTDNNNYIRCSNYIPVKELTNYKFSTNSNLFTNVLVYEYKSDFSYNMTTNKSITLNSYLTTNKDTKYITFRPNTAFTDISIKVKFEESIYQTPFTPYNQGSIDLKIENKNKFTGWIRNSRASSTNGAIATQANAIRSDYLFVKGNTDYFVGTMNNSIAMNKYICFYDINKKYISRSGSNNYNDLTVKTPINAVFMVLTTNGSYDSEEIMEEIIKDYPIQIEEGTEKTTFIEHQEQNIHFPLSEGQVLHKGDYLGKDGIHQTRQTIEFDGTETGNIYGTTDELDGYYLNISKTKYSKVINYAPENSCTHFKNLGHTPSWEKQEDSFTLSASYIAYFYFKKGFLPTFNDFKNWIKTQYDNGTPVQIEAVLEEETITPYTPEQQKIIDSIRTYKGMTYIYCINEIVSEKMILTYYPNTPFNDTLVAKNTFDRVTSDLSAQIEVTAGKVTTSVTKDTTSTILGLLNNGYLTADQVKSLVNGNAEEIATVKSKLTQTVTSDAMQIAISKAIDDGVGYLKNTLFTIDEKGMWIATNQDEFNARYNNRGMYLYSYEEMIASFDVNGSTIHGDLKLEGEFSTPNLKMENKVADNVNHVYIHWIGG